MNNEFKYVVEIPLVSCSSASDMCVWSEEHGIKCVWWPLHTENTFGRGRIVGFHFVFISEEDATAFKLRWL